jgi:hypothetical protein
MNQPLKQQAVKAIDAARFLHAETGAFLARCEPQPHSQMVRELGDAALQPFLEIAMGQVALLIETAADHLMALTRLVVEPAQTLAPLTCARVALESSVLAAWLCEPAIDGRTRAGRSFALRFEGFKQERLFSQAASGGDAAKAKIDQRVNAVAATAAQAGFQSTYNGKGECTGIAGQMPKITSLIEELFQMGDVYRLLSAVVHGHFWAVHQLGFNKVNDESGRASGMIGLEKAIAPTTLLFISKKVGEGFSSAILRRASFFGCESDRLKEACLEKFRAAGIELVIP